MLHDDIVDWLEENVTNDDVCWRFSRLAAVDGSGVVSLYNIDTMSAQNSSAECRLERKDVWSVKWAEVCSSRLLECPSLQQHRLLTDL